MIKRNINLIIFTIILFGSIGYTNIANAVNYSAIESIYSPLVNNDVLDMAYDEINHIIYIVGKFTYIGTNSGGGIIIDKNSSELLSNGLKINGGPVSVSIPDGNGGYYIGGNFSSINNVEQKNIAHINSDYTLDLLFTPDINGNVNTLSFSGDNLYVGGDFTSIGGEDRNNIAAIDITTGLATSFNLDINGPVYALSLSGDNLYVGGDFTSIGGEDRNRIAAIDITTGLATSFNPDANGNVNTLSLSGNNLYVGGLFTSIGGESRNRIAAIDTTTGLATSFNPDANGNVNTLSLSGNNLYVGGLFTSIGGESRNRIAAIDITTGLATSFNPDANGNVNTLSLSGDNLYVGGLFTSIGGEDRNNIAAIDITTGLATALDLGVDGNVNNFLISGDNLYVGGSFISIGTNSGGGVIIDKNSSELLSNELKINGGPVSVSIPDGNGGYYIGGGFSSINNVEQKNIAHINSDYTLDLLFTPDINGPVYALSLSGNNLYVGGEFTSVNEHEEILGITGIDKNTGSLTCWIPCPDWGNVNTLSLSGNNLYVGGTFTSMGGEDRNNIAAIDITTGLATSFNPDANGEVNTLSLLGNNLYIGGDFTSIDKEDRNNIAAIDITTGLATSFNPDANGEVNTLSLLGNNLYVGGLFTSIGGEDRSSIAAIDITTGLATSFNPDANGRVNTLSLLGNNLYVGGEFTSMGGESRNRIAAIDITTGLATSFNLDINGPVYALSLSGNNLYIGGDFTSIDKEDRNNIAAIDITTGLATSFNPDANGNVNTLSLSGNNLYVGGLFTSIGGEDRSSIAAINTTTGLATSFNLGIDFDHPTLILFYPTNDSLYLAIRPLGGALFFRFLTLDTISPSINILGPNPISIYQGDSYVDFGFEGTDNIDASVIVKISGSVNTNIIGTYLITYSTADSSGNVEINTKTVNVIPRPIFTGGGSGNTIPLDVMQTNTTVTPSSGGSANTIFSDNSSVEVLVPANTVLSNTTISINQGTLNANTTPVTTSGAFMIGSYVFNITATDNTNNDSITSFSNDLTITISIPNLPNDIANLGVYYYDRILDSWILVPNAVFDIATNKVTFTVNHLTSFAIFDIAGLPNNIDTQDETASSTFSWINGTWIKTEDGTTVYFLDKSNIRHAYPNEKIWNSYFDKDFSFVKTISKEQLSKYTLGKNVPFKKGTLMKIPSIPKVYVVGDNGVIQWIKSEAIAIGLYGVNWSKLVRDLSEAFFGDYTIIE